MSENNVSVIIPCYNGTRFLPEAIESVLAQTYQQFEIIAVDDGSTDNTGEVVARYPGVRYIRQENQGVAIARNTGLRQSQGKYLVFLDQDDRLLPNGLKVGVNCLNAHPDCGFVFGLCKLIRADGSPLPDPNPQLIETANYQVMLSGRSLCPPSTAIFRHVVFESIAGFDTSLVPADDYDIYLRIARAFPIYCHNQVIVEYRQHGNNQSRSSIAGTLEATLRALDVQWDFLKGNRDYEEAYRSGKKHWLNLFGPFLAYEVAAHLKARRLTAVVRVMLSLLRHYPQGFVKYTVELLSKLTQRFREPPTVVKTPNE